MNLPPIIGPQTATPSIAGTPSPDTSTPVAAASQAPAYRAKLRTDRTHRARPRRGFSAPAETAARLTGRDRWILAMLAEHRILTTTQITRLAFGTRRVAALRLNVLHELGVVHRFRPYTVTGSAPWHWLLAPTGAQVVADDYHTTLDALGYHPERLARLAVSLHLGHTVGVNDIHTVFAAYARCHPGTGRLTVWWSERRCVQAWAGRIRPDAYARWCVSNPDIPSGTRQAGGEVDWFLEYDTGTENLERVVAKLAAYARLAADTGIPTPVLFWLPGPRRETHLHHLIRTWQQEHPDHTALPIATAHADAHGGPTGRAWTPVLPGGTSTRVGLAELATAFPAHIRAAVTTAPQGRSRPQPEPSPATGPGWPAPSPVPPGPGEASARASA